MFENEMNEKKQFSETTIPCPEPVYYFTATFYSYLTNPKGNKTGPSNHTFHVFWLPLVAELYINFLPINGFLTILIVKNEVIFSVTSVLSVFYFYLKI